MSSSIAIPKRRKRESELQAEHGDGCLAGSSSSSYDSSGSLQSSPGSNPSSPRSKRSSVGYLAERRRSLLSESLSRSEYMVVNVGSLEAPRLITCVKQSQGFEWNKDIFMPSSYVDRHSSELEHRQDPITDIIVTDEEAAAILPQ